MALMDNVGLPVKEALPLLADILTKYGLRERIRLFASGEAHHAFRGGVGLLRRR